MAADFIAERKPVELRGYFMRHKTGGDVGFSWDKDDALFSGEWERIAVAPIAAQLDADNLPPLPAPDGYVAMTPEGSIFVPPSEYRAHNCYTVYTAEQVRQAQRDAVAAVAHKLWCAEVNFDGANEHIAELQRDLAEARRAQQPAQSIDTPEFRRLVNEYHEACEMVRGHAIPQWRALIAYIDGRTAGTAGEGYKLVPIKLTEEMHVAAVRAIVKSTGNDDFPPAVWSAMLAVAPSPQSPAGGEGQ